MRGKDNGIAMLESVAGITPAHAGKSMLRFVSAFDGGDHPRPCGEKELRNSFA